MTDTPPDELIGTADFSRLIGRPVKSLNWWKWTAERDRTGDYPPSEITVDTRGTWLCRASTALAWARDSRGYDGPVPEPMPLPDLVSFAYFQAETGRTRKTVQGWQAKKQLPDVWGVVSCAPLWERSVADEWIGRKAAA